MITAKRARAYVEALSINKLIKARDDLFHQEVAACIYEATSNGQLSCDVDSLALPASFRITQERVDFWGRLGYFVAVGNSRRDDRVFLNSMLALSWEDPQKVGNIDNQTIEVYGFTPAEVAFQDSQATIAYKSTLEKIGEAVVDAMRQGAFSTTVPLSSFLTRSSISRIEGELHKLGYQYKIERFDGLVISIFW